MAARAMLDKALCEHLKKYHRGQENAASSRELEATFHIKGTDLRRAVNRLRCDGCPICSDETDYFYAARQSEVRATAAHNFKYSFRDQLLIYAQRPGGAHHPHLADEAGV